MARTPSIGKKLALIVNDFISGVLGDNKANYSGRPAVSAVQMGKLYQSGKIRAERPTRDRENFSFIMDMAANCPAVERSLRKLAEYAALDEDGQARALAISIEIEALSDSDDDKKVASELRKTLVNIGSDFVDRTSIGYNAKHYTYKFLLAGDCFAELHIVLDTTTGLGRVEKIKELPTWQMRPVWNESGELVGYEQHLASGSPPITWSIPAQIIHFKNQHQDYFPYGTSELERFKGRWEAFKLIELDFVSSVHTKAVQPEVHYVGREGSNDETKREELDLYKQQLLDNPADINRFYVVDRATKKIEFPNTSDSQALGSLLSIRRELIEEFVLALGVPGHLSGNAKDIAGRHLSNSIDADFAKRIQSIRQDFTYFFYPSLLLEFALHGYNLGTPEKYGVKRITARVLWPDQSESRAQKSKRTVMEVLSGTMSLKEKLRQDGYQDPEAMIQEMLDEIENGTHPLVLVSKYGSKAPQLSNNNDQGQGVPTDSTDPENQKQVQSVFGHQLLLMPLNGVDEV